ncbi:L27 protein interaction domain containing protein [Nitzschia inconspicua]|uniref:L27 protein interaction domain containing protein n=1 Tax=Nitzschia inconspicua TaxID=303405 RepID=A0A9K3Q7I7_9STRA|nr:L27 protein interaction domain containing protein [Nitzschia inconspicua]
MMISFSLSFLTISTVTFLVLLLQTSTTAYSPEVSHRNIAGLWKLTQTTTSNSFQQPLRYPIKEFTVYPKDKNRRTSTTNTLSEIKKQSILLMLKESGQFEQYTEENDENSSSSIPDKLQYHKADILDRYSAFGRLRGSWELVDGKLILAPDRPTNDGDKKSQDAVLEGEVVAFSEQGLADNPALSKNNDNDDGSSSTISTNNENRNNPVLDTHLSVPKGRINVGRFMYPKHHPYFFDTPMYNPLIKGKFELKQVLGSLNTQQSQNKEEVVPELFRERDFYGKKFWLTSHPLQPHQPKGKKRWSIKYNKYVDKNRRTSTTNTLSEIKKQSILLMLKESGQFEQYTEENDENSSSSIPDKLQYHKADILDRYSAFGRLRGSWELVDGKLILAPDRPTNDGDKKSQDAVLEGEVVAFSEQGLADNPALSKNNDNDDGSSSTISTNNENRNNPVLDTHLSVPKGRINVGRFMYPKHHPYFFDTPMYNPLIKGKFELKQVLGSLNTQQSQNKEEVVPELFRERDFYGKKFWLTSHPLQPHQPKGKKRWSIKYNKYVEDPPPKRKKAEESADKPIPTVNVIEVEFFQNNTFATIGGMGASTILRGKFYVIGDKKDQLWMQIWRFGFGRSVSGSVYSEGTYLSKDDEKTYWGRIEYVQDGEGELGDTEGKDGDTAMRANKATTEPGESHPSDDNRRLLVKGSVIFGGNGLEPQPIGRFILTERTTAQTDEEDGDEEEDDDEEDTLKMDADATDSDDQPFFNGDDAFQ